MRPRIKVTYKHWKKPDVIYTVEGLEVPNNPQSERMVVEKDDGTYEDIIKSTIIEKKNI